MKAKLEVAGYDKCKDKCTDDTREENVTNKEGLAVESLETEDNIDNIEFKLVWNKQNFQVVFDADKKIEDLKEHIKDLTGKILKMSFISKFIFFDFHQRHVQFLIQMWILFWNIDYNLKKYYIFKLCRSNTDNMHF